MTEHEAGDILRTFIEEMERNGYGPILQQARIRILESENVLQSSDAIQNPSYQLKEFFHYTIELLEQLSNKHLPQIIDSINKYAITENLISDINVEAIDGTVTSLRELPDYSELILKLKRIQSDILES